MSIVIFPENFCPRCLKHCFSLSIGILIPLVLISIVVLVILIGVIIAAIWFIRR